MEVKNCLQEESSLQRGAFRMYWDLGDERSYAAVAKILDMSVSTIKCWARKFKWQERLKNWTHWKSIHQPKKNTDPRLEQVEDAIRSLDAAIVRVLQRLVVGNLKASTKDVLSLHHLEQRILKTFQCHSDISEHALNVIVRLSNNGKIRAPHDCPIIPESLVGEYLDFLENGI